MYKGGMFGCDSFLFMRITGAFSRGLGSVLQFLLMHDDVYVHACTHSLLWNECCVYVCMFVCIMIMCIGSCSHSRAVQLVAFMHIFHNMCVYVCMYVHMIYLAKVLVIYIHTHVMCH